MDDRRALMAACIANPDEDTPRLALADWLEEHGDEHDRARAEFIRLQIEANQYPEGDATRKGLEKAAEKLDRRHREAWLESLSPYLSSDSYRFVARIMFRRGLFIFISMRPAEFLKQTCQQSLSDNLARVGVEGILFHRPTRRLQKLVNSEAMRWVSWVRYPHATDEALAAFGASPKCFHLRTLHLDGASATDAGLRAFARSAGMTRLREIEIDVERWRKRIRGAYTERGLLALLISNRFPLLDTLRLGDLQPAKVNYQTLLASSAVTKLKELHIGNGVSMATIAACKNLTGLRALYITHANISDKDAETLLSNPALSNLTELGMYGFNAGQARLSKAMEKRLRERFGKSVLNYASEHH